MSNLGGGDLAGVGWAAGIERMAMNLDELSDCDKKIICFLQLAQTWMVSF